MNRRQILGFAVGPIGAGLLSVVSLPVMTWIFPPDMIGKLSMLQVAISLSTLLCCLGLDQAYGREYHESSDKPGLLLNTALPGLGILVVVLIGLTTLAPRLLSSLLFDERAVNFGFIVAVCMVVAYLSRFLSVILRMQDRGLAFSMSQLLSKLLLLLIVLGYAWLSTARNFMMLLAAQASALVLTFAIFTWNTRQDWWPAVHARVEPAKVARLLDFGWPLMFGGVASWGMMAMDRVFLRSMSSYSELAVYSVAASIASAGTVFAGIFNTIWSPMVYRWAADNLDMKRVDKISTQMVVLIFILVCLAGGGSWLLRYVLPDDYAQVPYLVVGCIVSPLLYTLSEVTGIGIALSRRTLFSMLASFGAVLLNVALCYMLVPPLGATGATIATACAFGLFFTLKIEFSAALWRKTRRSKHYIYTGCAVVLALAYALFGWHFPVCSVIIWWLILVGVVVFNRTMLLSLWSTARARFGRVP